MFRAPTTRANIRYSVVDMREAMDEAVLWALRRVLPGGKAIVYCRSKAHVKRLAGSLQGRGIPCKHYFRGIDSQRRDEAIAAFMQGAVRVLLGTGAVGMGLDDPEIRLVLHIDAP